MLYTACVSILDELKRKIKPYYVMANHGNDVVVPDQSDLEQYKNGALPWEGFKVSYLAKLMKPESEEAFSRLSVPVTFISFGSIGFCTERVTLAKAASRKTASTSFMVS